MRGHYGRGGEGRGFNGGESKRVTSRRPDESWLAGSIFQKVRKNKRKLRERGMSERLASAAAVNSPCSQYGRARGFSGSISDGGTRLFIYRYRCARIKPEASTSAWLEGGGRGALFGARRQLKKIYTRDSRGDAELPPIIPIDPPTLML